MKLDVQSLSVTLKYRLFERQGNCSSCGVHAAICQCVL